MHNGRSPGGEVNILSTVKPAVPAHGRNAEPVIPGSHDDDHFAAGVLLLQIAKGI